MTTLDQEEIKNLLTDKQMDDMLSEYSEVNYEYLLPVNTTYSNGVVNFDNQSIMNKFVVFSESYLQVPIRIKSSSADPFTEAKECAWKYGVQSLVNTLQVTSGSGVTLVNDRDLHLWNMMRNYLEKSRDEFDETVAELQTSIDKQELNTTNVGPRLLPVIDDTKNQGYKTRLTEFRQQAIWNAGETSFDMVVNIPLSDIHPFFKKHDFGIINQRYLIQFNLNVQNSGNTFQCLTVDDSKITPAITVSIAGFPGSSTPSLSQPRLVYKSVRYSPQVSKLIRDKMAAGFIKEVDYTVCDVYYGPTNQSTFANSLITSSVVAPHELYTLFFRTGSLTSPITLMTCNGSLTSSNVLINNTKYYSVQQDFRDHWNRLKAKMEENGSVDRRGVITYEDFVSCAAKFLVFNLDKVQGRLSSPNAACSVYLEGQADFTQNNAVAVNTDLVNIIVRRMKCKFSLSSGSGTIVVGATL